MAAVSVGIVEGRALLDLDYAEDSAAETDMNVVMTADGRLVEVQATAERDPFSRDLLDELLDLAAAGVEQIVAAQEEAIAAQNVPDLSTTEALLRLLLAATLGGAIGLERELRDHEAGLRTHLLVSLGACLFTLVSAYAWTDWTFSQSSGVTLDPTRIAAQIVTGIGFLGAGAIIVRGINVRGLTTAATLWVVAAIGMAAGTGYYEVAVGTSVLVLVSLGPLKLLSARLVSRVRPEEAMLGINLAEDGEGTRVLGADRGARRRDRVGRLRGRADARRRAAGLPPVGVGEGGGGGRAARRRRAGAVAAVGPVARLCSRNGHKLEELRAALPGWELELLDADGPWPAEDGATYEDNARGKAVFGRRVGAGEEWMLGEDSGIEAIALGGRPGVESARWAGDGVARLLEELADAEDRRARYVCAIVCLTPDGEELLGTGTLEGAIAHERRGDEGFGYDPIFVPDGETRTVAELGDEWKRRHSHRARAAAALVSSLSAAP